MKPALMKLHNKNDMILGDLINEYKLGRQERTFSNLDSKEEDLLDTLLKYGEENNLEFQLT